MQASDLNSVVQTANPLASIGVLAFLLLKEYRTRKNGDGHTSFTRLIAAETKLAEHAVTLRQHKQAIAEANHASALIFDKIEAQTSQISDMRVDVATLLERTARL